MVDNPHESDPSAFFVAPSGDYAYWVDHFHHPDKQRFRIVDQDGKVLGEGDTHEEALRVAGFLKP